MSNEILSITLKKVPVTLIFVYQRCLTDGVFPRTWKKARLVLLHRGSGKLVENPSSFKQLHMFDTASKMLERILLHRLMDHLELIGGLSPN